MGVPVKINWSTFGIGTSFFVPGTDARLLQQQILGEITRLRLDIDIMTKPVVERGMLGLRVWRVS